MADETSAGNGKAADLIIATALEALGRINTLVNNAGGSQSFYPVDEDTDDRIEAVIGTNLIGSIMLLRRVWPIIKSQDYGRIITMSSNTTLGMNGTLAHVCAKGGVICLTNVAAIEGEPVGILVNAVLPAAYTRGVALAEPGTMDWFKPFTPELAGEGVVYLCSEESKTAGGLYRDDGSQFGGYAIYGNWGIEDSALTAEIVAQRMADGRDMGDAKLLESIAHNMARLGVAAQLG